MNVVKSLQMSLKKENYNDVRENIEEILCSLGYEPVKAHSPFLDVARENNRKLFDLLRTVDKDHIKRTAETYVGVIDACPYSCRHFTNLLSEEPEGIIYKLRMGVITYPDNVEVRKAEFLGYGEPWEKKFLGRRIGGVVNVSKCLRDNLFVPSQVQKLEKMSLKKFIKKLRE